LTVKMPKAQHVPPPRKMTLQVVVKVARRDSAAREKEAASREDALLG
jgi:hypothetical protein